MLKSIFPKKAFYSPINQPATPYQFPNPNNTTYVTCNKIITNKNEFIQHSSNPSFTCR